MFNVDWHLYKTLVAKLDVSANDAAQNIFMIFYNNQACKIKLVKRISINAIIYELVCIVRVSMSFTIFL